MDRLNSTDFDETGTPARGASPDGAPADATGRAHRRTTLRRAVALGAAAGAIALLAVACGGGSKSSKTPKASAVVSTPTAGANIGLKTPPATISPGGALTAADLAARGTGQPGRGDFNGERLIIPKIKVNAPFSVHSVPGSGVMPNPNSWNDVAYYDFSNWPGLGGTPGKGGNVVVAGHVDYIHHGPAVFWDLRELGPGDQVQVQMKDGSTITYQVVFNKHTDAEGADFQAIVGATADESMTLITCTGDFANGHYNERQIVWAKRV